MRKFLVVLVLLCINFISDGQSISPASSTICPGGVRALTVSPVPAGTSFQWLQGPSYTVVPGSFFNPFIATTPGTYYVQISGASPLDTIGPVTIALAPVPTANFTFAPNSIQCGNKPYTFTSTSGSNLTYLWDFGDPNSSPNNSSTTSPTIHSFTGDPGILTQLMPVTLTVTNTAGCSGSVTQNVTINQVPNAVLTSTANSIPFQGLTYFTACSLSPVLFTFSNASQPTSNSNYQIIWGDASASYNSASPPVGQTHTYNVGNYILQYIVLGTNGCPDTTRYGVFVGSAPNGGIGTENPDLYKCTGATFSFPFLPSTFSNSAGTSYTITVDDNTAPTVYTQATLPPAFMHTFNTSSCGAGGSGINYFTVSILITNPCNIAGIPGSIGGIKISETPVANFLVSRDTICVNQTVNFTDISTNQYVTNLGTCSPGKSLWTVTPGVQGINWTITSGALGNSNGDPLPSGWNPAGSGSLQVQFITPGTYSVSLQTGGSDSCGLDQITKTICVNPVPTGSFSVNQNTGCDTLLVNTTTVTSTPTCGNNRYLWTVSYAATAGCTPSTSNYIYLSGNNTSVQPQFQFNTPGIYTLDLVVISPAAACTSAVATQVITVKGNPVVGIDPFPASICVGGTIDPSASVTCYTIGNSYAWSFPNGSPISSTDPDPTPIIYNTAGSYTVTVGVTNECGTTNANQSILVQDVTIANAGPTQTQCGSTITMAANTALTGTGTWTQLSGIPATITTPTSPITTITGLTTGTYVFTWTITNGGCISSSNVTINISSGPTTSNAGIDQDLCLLTSATLNANAAVVGTGHWTQPSGPVAVITDANSPTTTVTGLGVGIYVFEWTITYLNCSPSTDDVTISVYNNPSTAIAGNNQVICSSVATMAGNSPAIGTGVWTQASGAAGAVITNASSPTTTITGLNAGIYSFQWTISNGNCPSSNDIVQITVTDIPTLPDAGTDQSLCAVTSTTLSGNTATSGTGTWTQVSGPPAMITNATSASTSVTNLIPGTFVFAWTIGNNVCPSNSDNVTIIVSANATVANAGPDQTKCGTTVTMAASNAVVGIGVWTQLSGAAANIVNPSSATTIINGLTPGTYVFTWTITNGACVSSSNVSITISSGPTISNAGTDQDLCLASSATLNANVPSVGVGVWTQVSGAASTITNPSLINTTVTGLTVGTYVFRWTISFSNCTPSTDDVQIKIYANPTTANAGIDQNICLPSTQLAANAALIGIGAWTQTSGTPITITDPSSATTTISGLAGGTYSFTWTITNGPCPASNDVVQIIYSTIDNNLINGVTSICTGLVPPTITGSIPTGSVAPYTYQWQLSTDGGATWNNIPGATNVDYSPGVLTTSICYRRIVTTVLCSGAQGSPSNVLCITVNPDAHALFTASNTLLCAPVNLDTVITVTAFPLQNQQYNWYHDNMLIPGTTNGLPPSYIISLPGQTVVITLITTSPFGCRQDTMSITFNTRPSVTADFIKDTISGCGPLPVIFTNTSSILNNTIEFYWDFGNGTTLNNVMQPPSPVIYLASPDFRDTTYFITLKAFSGCDTTIKRDSVKVFANPKARFISFATGCSPFPDTIINNSFGQDASTIYHWDFGDGNTATTFTTGTFYHTYITGVVDTFTITLIMENRCGSDTQRTNVIVSPSYIQEHITINGTDLYGCAPHIVNFQNSSLGASVLYWNFGDGSPIEAIPNSQSTITHTYFTSGVFSISITLENYCTDTTVIKQVTVYDPPVASFTLSNTQLCTGNAVTTNNTSTNANSYEWFWGDATSTAGFNASHTYTTGGIYFIRLVVRKLNVFGVACTDTSAPVQVTVVDRIPAVIDIVPGNNACVPYTINVSANGAAAAAQVDWYFYDSNTAPGIFHVSGPTASYIYNVDGIDSVKLVVENTAGCKDSTVKIFTVYKTPLVNFTPINIKTCNTDTTAIFNVSLNYSGTDPVTYEWFINDIYSGNSNPFVYNFHAASGVTAVNEFTIKVLVRNSVGCGDTTMLGNFIIQTLGQQHIVVSPSLVQEQPHYTFSFSDTSLVLPNATYLWSPGNINGQQIPGNNITYTYGDTGIYHVKLDVQDYETGCLATDTVNVFILAIPGYLYVPNAFCPGCHKAELRQFLPLGKGLRDYHLSIFNTWGQKVFETRSLDANGIPDQPWNGNWSNGQNTQQGAFSWHIEAHYINGSEWKGMLNPLSKHLEKQGFISILR
ncbi:MAG: PKD domain-containing protein [Ferruginibacter sp.]